MEKIKNFIIILLLFLISLFAFTFKLGENPPGVYVDEAVTGYNAYSILKTGKDEYGKDFPAAFRFFGSYSPPLYVYLTTIPVYFLGLNEFSVRVVSAILGSLMVFVIYLFLAKSNWFDKKIIPLVLLLFIITPWNFFYARIGYEIYLGFFLFSLGILFLWLGLKERAFLPIGIITLSISTYGSHSQIYSAPIFLIIFLKTFFKAINKRYLAAGLILGSLVQLPQILLLNTNAFLNKSGLFYLDEILQNADKIILPKLISIPLSFLFSFLSRFVSYFSPANLFFNPDPDLQRSMPELSVFYNWILMPFLAGLFVLASKLSSKFTQFLIILCVSSVLPASLTKDPFSTQRALGLLLPFFLIISAGFQFIANKVSFKKFILFYGVLFCASLILLWRSYFVLLPAERAVSWSYGYKELSRRILENPGVNYVIDQSKGKPSYIELAFFLKTDPKLIHLQADPSLLEDYYNNSKFTSEKVIGNAQNRKMIWEEDIYKKQILVGDEFMVSDSQAREHFLTEEFRINDSHGYPVFKGFMTDPQTKCRETNFSSIFCKALELNTIKL